MEPYTVPPRAHPPAAAPVSASFSLCLEACRIFRLARPQLQAPKKVPISCISLAPGRHEAVAVRRVTWSGSGSCPRGPVLPTHTHATTLLSLYSVSSSSPPASRALHRTRALYAAARIRTNCGSRQHDRTRRRRSLGTPPSVRRSSRSDGWAASTSM